MTAAVPVRRGSLTISDCDRELAFIARQLPLVAPKGRATKRPDRKAARERLFMDADRWLDLRLELSCARPRVKGET